MAFFKTLKFILQHPLTTHHKLQALTRYAKWQLYFRLHPYPVFHPFVENTKLIAYKGLTGAVFSIYTGLEEFEDMAFMLHMLRPEDVFVDIGANIGSYTILSAGVVGCATVAVEPVPATFKILRQNVFLNTLDSLVELHNAGVGSKEGILKFTNSLDTINHVAAEGETNTIEVTIKKLDDLLSSMPTLMKIDVEGFEQEVLQGSERILKDHNLKAIIIELNGSGQRYGYSDENIHQLLIDLDFLPFMYKPFERALLPLESYGRHNTIYIRDIANVRRRIESARKIRVLHKEV